MEVGVSLRIRRTFEMNTVHQTFGATLSLIYWYYTNESGPSKKLPGEDGLELCESDVPGALVGAMSDWKPKWKPLISIKNVTKQARAPELTYSVIENPLFGKAESAEDKKKYKHAMKYICIADERHYVHIYSNLSLAKFPFDIQELKVELEIIGVDQSLLKLVPFSSLEGDFREILNDDKLDDNKPFDHVVTADCAPTRCVFEDMNLLPPKKGKEFIDEDGYELHEDSLDTNNINLAHMFTESKPLQSRRKESYSGLSLKMRYGRRSGYYMMNVAMIMGIIGSLALSTFARPDVPGRLQPLFALLLTTVAFKLVLVKMLPPVAYSTYLDKYVLGCLTFLVSSIVINMVMINRLRTTTDTTFDTYVFYIMTGIWSTFNTVCVIVGTSMAYSQGSAVGKITSTGETKFRRTSLAATGTSRKVLDPNEKTKYKSPFNRGPTQRKSNGQTTNDMENGTANTPTKREQSKDPTALLDANPPQNLPQVR